LPILIRSGEPSVKQHLDVAPLASVVLPPPEEVKLATTNVLWCNDGVKDKVDSVVAVLLGLIDDCDKGGATFVEGEREGSKTNIDVLVLRNGSDPFSAAADIKTRSTRYGSLGNMEPMVSALLECNTVEAVAPLGCEEGALWGGDTIIII
jgi:hypothetical protein